MLHVDPTTPSGVVDTLLHVGPVLAPITTFCALLVARLTGGK